jgi:hypothetical protein
MLAATSLLEEERSTGPPCRTLVCRRLDRGPTQMNGLERRLTFYRWHSVDGPPPFDRIAAAKAIENLPDDATRKLPRGEFAADVLVRAVGTQDTPTLLSLLRLRDFENRPWLRAPGELPQPAQMRREQDLIDFAQIAIWGDGFAAFAQGGHSPPPSGLIDFLARRADQHVWFSALYERDVVERLRNWRGVRSVSLVLRNSQGVQDEINARLGPFEGLLAQLRGQPDSVVLRQEMTVPRRGRGARSSVLSNVSTQDVVRLAEGAEAYDAFQVSGITPAGRIEHLDLIRQRLQVTVSLPRAYEGGHRPDDAETFKALLGARRQLDDDGRLATAAEAAPLDQLN